MADRIISMRQQLFDALQQGKAAVCGKHGIAALDHPADSPIACPCTCATAEAHAGCAVPLYRSGLPRRLEPHPEADWHVLVHRPHKGTWQCVCTMNE